jgi:hypothetical protein
MAKYDFSLPSVNIPAPQGGLISGFAGEVGNRLDNRNAATAYNPLLDSVYGAGPAPAAGGFLARLFGGAQPAPMAGAAPRAGGIGSDAVASARASAAAPQVQANMAPPNMPPRAAVEALLLNLQTRAFASNLLARSQGWSGGQGWGGGAQAQGAVSPAGYPPANGANGMPGRQYTAAEIPVGQTIVQNGMRFRKYPDGSVRSV